MPFLNKVYYKKIITNKKTNDVCYYKFMQFHLKVGFLYACHDERKAFIAFSIQSNFEKGTNILSVWNMALHTVSHYILGINIRLLSVFLNFKITEISISGIAALIVICYRKFTYKTRIKCQNNDIRIIWNLVTWNKKANLRTKCNSKPWTSYNWTKN